VPSPADRAALIEFIHLVNRVNQSPVTASPNPNPNPDSDPPIIVNCSAGIGRTGSFIAINSLLRSGGFLKGDHNGESTSPPELSLVTPMPPLPPSISADLIAQEIDSLRDQRPGMVQSADQVVLVYEVLVGVYGSR
jgi:protein-tyrosine phosphatase